jgi:hypothetical protein
VTNHSSVDAQEIWQIINLYAGGGYILERRHPAPPEGRKENTSAKTLWPIDSKGDYITGWHPERREIDVLVEGGILEPETWQETQQHEGLKRRYKLLPEGQRLAALSKDEALAYFAEKGIHEHKHEDIS